VTSRESAAKASARCTSSLFGRIGFRIRVRQQAAFPQDVADPLEVDPAAVVLSRIGTRALFLSTDAVEKFHGSMDRIRVDPHRELA
jgi:hypothetical protein